MVCLEVARPESVDLPSLKRNLVAQGYLRAFAHGEILRLEDEDWTLEEGEPLLVVQDGVREPRGRPCAWAAAWPM